MIVVRAKPGSCAALVEPLMSSMRRSYSELERAATGS
jgi:hypothetical protein